MNINTNRFYKVTNPKDKQYQHLYIYINLDDISSIYYPNESLNVGIVITKTGKDIYIQKDELDNIIKLLNIINISSATFMGKPINSLTSAELFELVKSQSEFNIYEPDKNYFPGKDG